MYLYSCSLTERLGWTQTRHQQQHIVKAQLIDARVHVLCPFPPLPQLVFVSSHVVVFQAGSDHVCFPDEYYPQRLAKGYLANT